MQETSPIRLIDDFLGSVQIFSSAVNDLLEEQLREVTGSGLTFSQLKLLNLIAHTEGHTITDVAAFLGVSNAAASKAVDRLVRRGLLNRTEAASDRRAVELSVTPEGKKLLTEYEGVVHTALNELFGGLSPKELRDTARLLDRLSISMADIEHDLGEVCFRCGIHFRDRCLLRQARRRDCFFHSHKKKVGNGEKSDAAAAPK
jgi:DNA-binding MarR family transcriptional regulator